VSARGNNVHDHTKAKADRAARNARYYRRKQKHKLYVGIEVDEVALDFLHRLNYLNERDAGEAAAIARAIESLLRVSAKT
jgi:hypothetical protein